ncbi:MAG: hypothetical protein CMO81_09065 [Waddliaceae bacterium]|nr:hypothetical protein [Waddliaceae bacterium]
MIHSAYELKVEFEKAVQEFNAYSEKWARSWNSDLQKRFEDLKESLKSLPISIDRDGVYPSLEKLLELKEKVQKTKKNFDEAHNAWYAMLWEPKIEFFYHGLIEELDARIYNVAQMEVQQINNWVEHEIGQIDSTFFSRWERAEGNFQGEYEKLYEEIRKSSKSKEIKEFLLFIEGAKKQHKISDFYNRYTQCLRNLGVQGEFVAEIAKDKNWNRSNGQEKEVTSQSCEVFSKIAIWHHLLDTDLYQMREDLKLWKEDGIRILSSLKEERKKLNKESLSEEQQEALEDMITVLLKHERNNVDIAEELYQRFRQMLSGVEKVICRLELALENDEYLSQCAVA